ncbi:MAG: lysophospholipid acyltransferase family protein [Patescibacteria group bacterium]|nr:lysophospholipid acyltransferase family protein [Patescibacteria group bacterium]
MAYPILRQTLMRLFRRRIYVTGLENLPIQTPYILVANHVSYLDAPMIGIVLAVERNARAYYLTHKGVAKWFGRLIGERFLGMISIPPDNKAQVIEIAKTAVKAGKNIGIFPEGGRNYDTQQLKKGKTGAARLVLATDLPVVPIGVIAPPLRTIGGAIKTFFFTRQPLGIVLGKPLEFSSEPGQEITKERLESITRDIMGAIGELCHKIYPY